jgi:peptidyl-prolyl cis-trans isomerase SurA
LIKPSLYDADLQEAHHFLDSIRQQIVWDSISFNNAVKRFAFKQSASYLQGGRMINQSTGNYLFSKTELDPDVFFSIDTMKINDISHPIEFKMPGSGEVAFRLIRLDNRTVPHKADIKYDYDKIKRVALEDKKSKEMNDWMSKKLENTYLWIDGEYNSCNLLNKWGLPNKNMGN